MVYREMYPIRSIPTFAPTIPIFWKTEGVARIPMPRKHFRLLMTVIQ